MKKGKYCDIADDLKCGKNLVCGSFVTIESDVIVGNNVEIENYSMIKKGARIGDNVFIGTYSKIGQNANIDNNCRMTAYCEIRDTCKVGKNVSFGSRCTLSAGTIVEDDVIIKYAFVATDVPVLRMKEKKTCILKKGSQYGANVTIMPGVTVGVNSEIGAFSMVRHDVPHNEIWYGSPAKFYKKKEFQ